MNIKWATDGVRILISPGIDLFSDPITGVVCSVRFLLLRAR
jgi:hypothetical protein